MKRNILLLIIATFAICSASAREVIPLNNNWRFYFTNENSADNARVISIPHTWTYELPERAISQQPTTANYIRTIYGREEWNDKRVFIKFYGVESVADIILNGHHIGEHRGGSTAFTFEIGDKLTTGSDNRLQVIVNNAPQNDVLPTSHEEDNYGGIYRNVELIVTEKCAISPLYYGSEGVLIHQKRVSDDIVEGDVELHLTSTTQSKHCYVAMTIQDPDGAVIYQREIPKAAVALSPITIPFSVTKPKLWSPEQSSLYTFNFEVQNNEASDNLSVTTGFRSIASNFSGPISINGKPIVINAVTLYHDYPIVGGAASAFDIDNDLELIDQIGANTIRSANHPHSQHLYNRCDQNGRLVWIDFPLVKSPFLSDIAYYPSDRFHNAGKESIREIIAQNINHPSVVMWGLFSLLSSRGDDVTPYLKEIKALTKKMDPSRPTVAVSDQDGSINNITDLIMWKQNTGWERGQYSDIDIWRNALHSKWSNFRSGVAYGESGRIDQQSSDNNFKSRGPIKQTTWLPEARQRQMHEEYATMILSDSLFWGVCITNMFDFKTSRNPLGENNAGAITFDRRDRKDIFYLYKANWNRSEPTLHIAGRRNEVANDSLHCVRVYASDTIAPVLYTWRDTITMKSLGSAIFEADSVTLRGGRNKLVVKNGEMADSIEVELRVPKQSASATQSSTLFTGTKLESLPKPNK